MRYDPYSSMERDAYASILKHGAVKAVASFSGGNDEGGVDAIRLLDKDDAVVKEFGYDDFEDYDFENDQEVKRDPVVSYSEGLVEGRYGGFGGETSASGRIPLDALARTTSWKVSESHMVESEWSS